VHNAQGIHLPMPGKALLGWRQHAAKCNTACGENGSGLTKGSK